MKAGWRQHILADVAEKITDGSHNPPKGVSQSEYMMLSSKNVFDDCLHYSEPRYLDAEHFKLEDKRTGVMPGDVLLTIVGTIGRCAVVRCLDPKFTLQRSVAVIRPKQSIVNSRFLMYSLIERTEDLNAQARGVAQKGIYLENLRQLNVVLPPLPEQQRIVTLLDEAFDGIATAKANAEKNLRNARAIFESHLQSVFTQRGDGWVEKSLGELGTITSSKRIFKSEYVAAGIPFYRTKEIKELANGRDITTELFISETRYNEIKAGFGVPKEGDILLTAIGTIGEIWVVDGEDEFYFKDGNVLWLKEFTSVNPQFLRYVLLSFVDSLNKMSHGSAYSALPIQRLNVHRIFLPPKLEQEQIVTTLDALYEATQRLEVIYQQKLSALDELKKSLLHRAFNGDL